MPMPPRSPFHAPALIARHGLSSILTPDGELLSLPASDLKPLLRNFPPPLLVHGPATLRILDLPPEPSPAPWLDLLELFLFVHPTRTVTPTARGLALDIGLITPEHNTPLHAGFLPQIAQTMLSQLQEKADTPEADRLCALLIPLQKAGWSWSSAVAHALGTDTTAIAPRRAHEALHVWQRLPEWEDHAPRPSPGTHPVSSADARTRLAVMLGAKAEPRPGQADFASVATHAFAPRETPHAPNIVLAEAGTGTGKTMGYIAPASLWAERNGGAAWISTYTRHLQRQIEQELTRLYPDPDIRRERAVIRKGRENYLCLLNLEDIIRTAQNRPDGENHVLIPLVFLTLWVEGTADGDVMGGDLPGWFGELFGHGLLASVADRRGECIYSACRHYSRCFIEHGIRRARLADLVIANHALVLSQAAWNALLPQDTALVNLADENGVPTRYVFDEGHHIPDAADSAFSRVFSGLEAAELRRWILGAEGGRSRARGLRRRMEDILDLLSTLQDPLEKSIRATQKALPRPGWTARLSEARQQESDLSTSTTPGDAFLAALDQHLALRSTLPSGQKDDQDECDLHPVTASLADSATTLCEALVAIVRPLRHVIRLMSEALVTDEGLETMTRQRLEAAIRSLYRRAVIPLESWHDMLSDIITPPEDGLCPVFVDFVRYERLSFSHPNMDTYDISLNRHWLDPTLPFASTLQHATHGLLVTSATLRDRSALDDEEESWRKAEDRVGIPHFLSEARRASLISPFNYTEQTRAYVITDVSSEIRPLAQAFLQLFECSQGSALGLFTAIRRLKAVHQYLHEPLGLKGIPLYAQHVDAMDNATLVDIFRTERESCLLGTDAMRDGVDVPGDALRMVVFERTPWPRPDILHRERRRLLSGGQPKAYDDQIARMRLRQAFGRLIRRADDHGVFIMLDRRTPTRLFSAFPEGVYVQRLTLAAALEDIRAFLKSKTNT